jgi:hypothetical protein
VTEPTINQWQQYVIDGDAYQRVTTLAGLMEDRHNLEKWGKRNVARGLTLRQDILAAIAACPDTDRQRLDGLCDAALEAAAASSGANLGTALHEMTARLDSGEDFRPLPPWDVDVKAYQDLLQRANITICPEWVEQTCVVPELGVAGTFDRLVEIRDRLYVADLKTGADLSYGWCAIAIQLACYANAEFVWDWDHKERRDMPEVNRRWGLVFHLPAGTGTANLYKVDIEAGWEAAKRAVAVREWRKQKRALAVKAEL